MMLQGIEWIIEGTRKMSQTLFTARGCSKCKIAKRFMEEQGITYEEADIKGSGMEVFRKFYAAHRKAIFRGKEGIEFPVFTDGNVVRQGIGIILSYLAAGTDLDGFIGRNELTQGWIGGINLSEGDSSFVNDLVRVLGYLKKNGVRLQFETNGKNASVLERLIQEGLGDRVYMDVKGPLSLYSSLLGEEIDPSDVEKSISLVKKFPEYSFYTTVAPVVRREGKEMEISYMTPEEIGETAKLISDVTDSHQEPYVLKIFDPKTSPKNRLKNVEKMPGSAMFKYRTAAREHQRKTEIEKGLAFH